MTRERRGATLALCALLFSCAPMRSGTDRAALAVVRPMRPLAGSLRYGLRPEVRWGGDASEVTVQFCADRRCARVLVEQRTSARRVRPERDLPVGTVFWRVSRTGASPSADGSSTPWTPTWSLVVARAVPGVEDTGRGGHRLTAQFDADDDGDTDIVDPDGRIWRNEDRGAVFAPSGVLRFAGDRTPRPVGDLNGDGLVDLAAADTRTREGSGTVHVYLAPLLGTRVEPDATLAPPAPGNARCGQTVLGGDFDGDGFGDLAVSCPFAFGARGQVLVFRGTPDGPMRTPSYTLDASSGPASGLEALAADDTNDDGADELLLGWPGASGGGYELRAGGRTLDALETSRFREVNSAALPGGLGSAGALASLDGASPYLLTLVRPTRASGCTGAELRPWRGGSSDAGVAPDPSALRRIRCVQSERGASGGTIAYAAFADLDGDGSLDAAWSEGQGADRGIALARGVSTPGVEGDAPRYDGLARQEFAERFELISLATADLDDDGAPEVLCSFALFNAWTDPSRVRVLRAAPTHPRTGPLERWHELAVAPP